MNTTLYGMAHSHPAVAVRMMLDHKGMEARVWDILPGLHPLVVRAAGFEGGTVPALRVDGHRVQGTLAISRTLDELVPEPPLFPADPQQRAAVVDAERWGHDELQALARRVFRFAALHTHAIRVWMAQEVVGVPLPGLVGLVYKPVMAYFARAAGATAHAVRRDLERLGGVLDHADALLDDGTIGGEQPNAADFQILCSIRLLLCHSELRPAIERRACGQAALRLVPHYPEPIPAGLPPAWLPWAPSEVADLAAPERSTAHRSSRA